SDFRICTSGGAKSPPSKKAKAVTSSPRHRFPSAAIKGAPGRDVQPHPDYRVLYSRLRRGQAVLLLRLYGRNFQPVLRKILSPDSWRTILCITESHDTFGNIRMKLSTREVSPVDTAFQTLWF